MVTKSLIRTRLSRRRDGMRRIFPVLAGGGGGLASENRQGKAGRRHDRLDMSRCIQDINPTVISTVWCCRCSRVTVADIENVYIINGTR